MTKDELQTLAVATALNMGLDPALVCAVCAHESQGWNTWASRYERNFYQRYISPMQSVKQFGPTVSQETERQLRATSFGLMQVMGQVAREFGFEGEYLTELCEPAVGILYGCKRLKHALDKTGGAVHAALLDFNGGGNANYPQLVMNHYQQYAYLNSSTRRPE